MSVRQGVPLDKVVDATYHLLKRGSHRCQNFAKTPLSAAG